MHDEDRHSHMKMTMIQGCRRGMMLSHFYFVSYLVYPLILLDYFFLDTDRYASVDPLRSHF